MTKKCGKNYRIKEGRCVRIARAIGSSINQNIKNVRYVILVTAIILAFILVINISDTDTVKPLAISLVFLGISLAFYSIKEYQDDLIGLEIRTIPINFVYALLFVFGFVIITSLVPYFSLAYPRYPGAIGESLRGLLIILIAPLTETFLFQSSIFAFFRNLSHGENGAKKFLWILLASLIFSLFHLGAYVFGLYFLSIEQGWTAFTSNISAFITAFLFSFTIMIFALRKGVTRANASFIILAHMGINFFAYGMSVVKFV